MPTPKNFVSLSSKVMVGPILDKFNELAPLTPDGKVSVQELREIMLEESQASKDEIAFDAYKARFSRAVRYLLEGKTIAAEYASREKRFAKLLFRPQTNTAQNEQ